MERNIYFLHSCFISTSKVSIILISIFKRNNILILEKITTK